MRQALIIIMGVLGVLAAVDAAILFVVLLVVPPTPYLGLLMFVVAPMVGVGGVALAWLAYQLHTRQTTSPP